MRKNRIVALVAILILFVLFYFIKFDSNDTTLPYDGYATDNIVADSDWDEVINEEAEEVQIVQETDDTEKPEESEQIEYVFRNKGLLNQHYEKHGKEMGFSSALEYQTAASNVINNTNALTKIEAEDGDYVYYIEDTNEFVVLSTDGYIRTYFLPNSGKKYYDKQ